ncbi:major facilitator superfamily domain-containing protein [Dipodascopsis tothii]|uniref:major facilitator superfamily domain-containing protein n=1 Tax=Dipodascopsis tothii TaxID=44089 RepID=UPI0034CE8B89
MASAPSRALDPQERSKHSRRDPYEQEKCDGHAWTSDSGPEEADDIIRGDSKYEAEVTLYPPDVGVRAWLNVAGGFCALFCSFGYVNVLGVFLNYYKDNQLSDYTSSEIAWITSLNSCILIIGGLIVGRLFDMYGPRPLTIFGSIFMAVGVMTTSVSKTYYQFLLSQGICTSIGSSALYYVGTSTVASWFKKHRSFALGICVSGSSVGGVVLPIVFRQVVSKAGFGWAVRSLGFIMLFMACVSIFSLQPRLQPRGKTRFNFKHDYIRPFKYVPIVLLACGLFCLYWGVLVPFNYIPGHAVAHHFSLNMADYLVSFLNAGSFFGRILVGFMADKIGAYNCYIMALITSGLLCLGLWLPAASHAAIIVYAVLYGFFSGATVSLMAALIAAVSPVEEIGTRMGAISALMALSSLSGAPIAGAILKADHELYYGVAIWSGVQLLASAVFVISARIMIFGTKILKKA